MLSYQQLTAATVAGLLLVSGMVAGVTTAQTEADSPTEISSCTIIDEPGTYELSADITNNTTDACIGISAENVTLDGNNHTIRGDGDGGPAIVDIGATTTNIRIENVTVRGWSSGISIDDGVVRDSTVTENEEGILVRDAHVRVVDNRIANNSVGIQGYLSGGTDTGPLVRGNQITDNTDSGVQAYRSDLHLTDNIVADNGDDGVVAEESDIVSTNNTVVNNSGRGLAVSMGQLVSTNDVIEDNVREGIAVYGQADITGTTVRDNARDGIEVTGGDTPEGYGNATITDAIAAGNNGSGIVGDSDGNLTIENSVVRNNTGDGIRAADGGGDDEAVAIDVQGSVIADNGGLGVNAGALVANATDNYWGASDGPGSADDPDAPFADPVTGALANGSGDEVSESSTENGTSNVHFDPFLAETPTTDDEADGRTAYQIDVAAGEVIEDLGSDEDAFYGRQGRLLQANSVLGDGTITDTVSVPPGEVTRTLDGCTVTYDAVAYDGESGEATLDVAVEDCKGGVTLTLAAYELPDGTVEFQRDVADQQELVAYETVTLDANTDATITIAVTEGERSTSDDQPEEDETTDTQTDTEPEQTTQQKTPTETTPPTETETESPSTPTPDGSEDTTTRTETESETETETATPAETATATETPAAGSVEDLEITSVTKNAPGDEYENLDRETVTITNTGDGAVDLSGVTLIYGIGDENQQRYTFAAGFTLDAGESVTVHTGSGSDTQTDVYLGSDAPVLNNAEDETLRLVDEAGNVINETTS